MILNIKKWTKTAISYGITIAVVMLMVSVYQQRNVPKEQVPNLEMLTLTGKNIRLSEITQKSPAVIYLWASWCSICKLVSPAINGIAEEYPVMSVALQSGDDSTVTQYAHKKALLFPIVNDSHGDIAKQFGVAVTPTIFIIGAKGKIHFITTGLTSYWGLKIRLLLANFL